MIIIIIIVIFIALNWRDTLEMDAINIIQLFTIFTVTSFFDSIRYSVRVFLCILIY